MNKKKKDDLYESKWEVFLRNYNQVPGFKAIVRLGVYFILFAIFILIVNFGGKNMSSEEDTIKSTTTTIKTEKITYKDMLNNLAEYSKSIEFTSIVNNYETRITAKIDKGIMTGIIENKDLTKKFQIEDNQIYEIVLDEKILNPDLFNNINREFLIPSSLVNILNSNQSTKRKKEEKTIYNYNINYNGITYDTIVVVENNSIKSIDLTQDSNQYRINYS